MNLFDKKFVYFEWDDVLEGKKVFFADTLLELRRYVEQDTRVFMTFVKRHDGDYPFTTNGTVCFAMCYYDPNYECKRAYVEGKVIQTRNKGGSNWRITNTPEWSSECEYRVKSEESEEASEETDDCYILSMSHAPYSILSINKNIYPVEGQMILTTKGLAECLKYTVENYCNRCVHKSQDCGPYPGGCQGFKEKVKCECKTCKHFSEPDYLLPCRSCLSKANYEPKIKRRMTNRELARWLAEGNGECMCDDISMTCWTCWRYVVDEANQDVRDGVMIRYWYSYVWIKPEVEE